MDNLDPMDPTNNIEIWPSDSQDYQFQTKIGQGAFSVAWKAICLTKANQPVAIKIMDLENINSTFEDIRQEVTMMRLSDHPNILKCYTSFVHIRELWLVTQLMDKGSCWYVMQQAKKMGL